MGNSLTRYQQITPINKSLGPANGSNKVLLFQGQPTNVLGNNPDLIGSGANLLYSAKTLNLTVSWHIQSGRSLDAFLRPDGLITPQTIDNVKFSRLLVFWIAAPKKAPTRFHEILLIKNDGYRIQQADLLDRVRTIPMGEDTKLFASVENGPLTSADLVIIQGEIEESVEVIHPQLNLSDQLTAIELKLDSQLQQINLKLNNLQGGATGTAQAATLTEVLYRDEAWKPMYFNNNWIWRTDPENAIGILRLGYLISKNILHFAVTGGFTASRLDRIFRIKTKSDDSVVAEVILNPMVDADTHELRSVQVDTSTYSGIEIYLEFEDIDTGTDWAWFGVGMNFWVE
ncbi:MAG: hypothetical protein ACLFT0_12555 [Spirulinaceae cyanobacterium]